MENLEGAILFGDIVKDDEIILVNQKAEFSFNKTHSTLASNAYSFQLALEKKPNLKVNDKCKLITNEKIINLSVIYLECPLDMVCFVIFAT